MNKGLFRRRLRDYFVAAPNEVGYMLSSAEKNVQTCCKLQFIDCQKCLEVLMSL